MKMQNGVSRKLHYSSKSVAISAAVICAVLLINILVSALFSNNLWFIDLTTEPLYTLSDEAEFLLDQTFTQVDSMRDPDDPVQVEIIFCADPDLLTSNDRMRYVYYTALDLQKHFPDNITVSTRDVWENPSSVDDYRTNAYTSIYPSQVIVSSGSEFRLYTNEAFFAYSNTDSVNPLGYDGEKTFVKGIIAVTRAESPICALTVNHGEPFATEEGRQEYSEFLKVIEGAGYDIAYLDLAKDPIPENCRLIITFDPQTDFASEFLGDGVSEVKKLSAYLDEAYSYMVFADADTPKLTNLEEYLEEWGIVFNRYEKTNAYQILDSASSLDVDGNYIIAQYETESVGGSLTLEMREASAPPKIVFGNACSISYSPTYEQAYVMDGQEDGIGAFVYGKYVRNMVERNMYDVFRSTDTAFAYVYDENGELVTDDNGDPVKYTESPFRLMTMTEEIRLISEGVGYTNAYDYPYVCAVASTEFASNASLTSSAYGNADVLLGVLRFIGKEVVPVGLDFKNLYDSEIDEDYNPQSTAAMQTVLLAAWPVLLAAGTGSVVLIKRKFRK